MEDMKLTNEMADRLWATIEKLEDFSNVLTELENVNTPTLHATAKRFVAKCSRGGAPSSYRGRKPAILDVKKYRDIVARIRVEDKALSKIAV